MRMLGTRALLPMAAFAVIAILSRAAVADEPTVQASIGATITDDDKWLVGTVHLLITNDTGVPLNSIPLWLYPNRFAQPAPGLTDRTVNWIYPSGWSEGRMELRGQSWNDHQIDSESVTYLPMPQDGTPAGSPDAIARVPLPDPLQPGERGTLKVDFGVKIPERKGRFGRWRGSVSLGGGWFPRPLTDLTGERTDLPPATISVDLKLSIPGKKGAVVHDSVFERQPHRRALEVSGITGNMVTVVLLDLMHVTERKFSWGTGLYVSRELPQSQPDWKDTRGNREDGLARGIKSLGRISYPDRGLEVLRETAEIALDLAPDATLPKRVVMVEIPAWDRLAQQGSGAVLITSRLWRLIPTDAVFSFHDIALARSLGTALSGPAARRWGSREHSGVTTEVAGALVGDIYADRVHEGMRSIKDLVGFAAFLPKIDNLLYAPQVPFRESYSIFIEEEDPLRDSPLRSFNQLPCGRRVQAKLVDLIGEDETAELVAHFLTGGGKFDDLVREKLGDRGQRFFDQWYGPYPSVNYALAETDDAALPNGRYRHTARIVRRGERIFEPVTVRMIDEDGQQADLRWDGESMQGTVEWTSSAPIDRIVLDPENRLIEDPNLTDDHPMADNRDPLPWRPPMITRLLFWGDTETFEPNIQVAVALRQQFDITNSFHLSASYTPRNYGGTFSYYRHFCGKRTLNSRTCYFGPTLSVTRHEEAETAGTIIPEKSLFAATMGTLGLSIGRDTRNYFSDPRNGTSVAGWVSYSAGRADDGHAVHVGSGGARGFALWTPAMGHTFALYGGVTAVVGEPPATDLASLSNRLILRGFELDETYGRLGVYLATEYRHNIIDLSRLRMPLSSFDRLQGAIFIAAGTISWPGAYDGMFSSDRTFVEVGYGLRLHILSFGINQYLIALDLAFPVAPSDRQYEVVQTDGSIATADRRPFKLVFGITQTY